MRLFYYLVLSLVLLCASTTASSAGGRVALSFDDGPDAVLTPWLLDILREAGVKATFCLVGQRVAMHPDIVRRMYAEGHELCNHSWSHPQLTAHNIGRELARTDAVIRAATGTVPAVLRAPYGDTRAVGSCYGGRPFVGWGATGNTEVWRYRVPSRVTHAAVHVNFGQVVLMHDIHRTTVVAVPAIIAGLLARGGTIVHASVLWNHHCTLRAAK